MQLSMLKFKMLLYSLPVNDWGHTPGLFSDLLRIFSEATHAWIFCILLHACMLSIECREWGGLLWVAVQDKSRIHCWWLALLINNKEYMHFIRGLIIHERKISRRKSCTFVLRDQLEDSILPIQLCLTSKGALNGAIKRLAISLSRIKQVWSFVRPINDFFQALQFVWIFICFCWVWTQRRKNECFDFQKSRKRRFLLITD